MFKTEITINGNKHEKINPTLNDYRLLLAYNEKNKGKSFLTDSSAVEDAVQLIADWFGNITTTEIESSIDLVEIFKIYREIESNIAEVFTGVPLKTALKTINKALGK